jgi:general secretion pathway protein G
VPTVSIGVAINARRKREDDGFTLIELLVVLVILGLIVSFATPQVLKYLNRAKVDAAHIQIENLSGALDLYRLDMSRYPTQQEGLQALVERPAGADAWNGPYIKQKKLPPDPWNHPFNYRFPGQHGDYDLYSRGADESTGDENQFIKNW